MTAPYPIYNILFLDIETVPQYDDYSGMPEEWKKLWDHKANYLIKNKEDETVDSIYNRAGIYAEFGKVVCISCGVITGHAEHRRLLIKSFFGDDEKPVLSEFCEMIRKWSADGPKYMCAHNGKEFDFPYLCRRLIVNNIPIPGLLQLAGKKPWEVPHLDTLELWKFGDYKSFTSLNLLAQTLGIPTSKDDIDGSMVWEVYWKEKNLARIVTYCQKDVITLTNIFLRLNGEPALDADNIEIKKDR
jgi:3'-5' exonuclease